MPNPMPRVLRCLVPALACAAALFPLRADAGELAAPFLVKDFDPGSHLSGLNPRSPAAAGDRVFFSGWDDAHGDEPWTSDDGAGSPRRLADLCHGPCSSYPAGFVQLGEAVVFYGNDDDKFRIHRLADGKIREIASFGAGITQWTQLGSLVFFATRDNVLWRTDCTREGTFSVGEFHPVPSYLEPPAMAAVNGAIYFADAGSLQRLTADGTVREIFSLGGSPGATASFFTALDAGRFLFAGCANSFTPCQAYVSDGTSAGTRSLEPAPDAALTAGARQFQVWRGRAYFEVSSAGIYNRAIVSTDGTPAGTRPEPGFPEGAGLVAATATHLFYAVHGALHSLDAGGHASRLSSDEGSYTELLGRLGEIIVFTYGDPGGIARPGFSRVAATDGTPAGTADLLEGGGSAGVVLGDAVYFAGGPGGISPSSGLWRTDGSAAGTEELGTASRVPASSWPRPLRVAGTLVAEATDEMHYENRHLYQIDPSSLESRRVSDDSLQVIAAGPSRIFLATSPYTNAATYAFDGEELSLLPLPSRPAEGAMAGDGHYFFFTNADPGQKLWESDGTAAGTRLLIDFPARDFPCTGWCSYTAEIAISGDHVYFSASGDSPNQRLSVWDRATGERRVLRSTADPAQLMVPMPGGGLVFSQGGYSSGMSLWKSDGTAAGTLAFHHIEGPTNLMRVFEMGGRLYFGLDPGYPAGEVLWTSDLTAEGTRPVTAIGDLSFFAAAVAGQRFFFSTDNGAGRELGVTDGSAAGTLFFDLRPGPEGSHPDAFFALDDGRLVFTASADGAGDELWISDGSALGTYRLTDLYPGEGAAAPSHLAQVGDRLFFQATDGQTGRELWALDLPPAGAPAPCPAGSVCLGGGRFEISLVAHAPDGDFPARKELGNATSAVYSFFSPGNWEMLLKVLDGCAINGHHWVYAAAATDAGWTLRIRDRTTGAERVYGNELGQASPAITDAGAFSCGGAFSGSSIGAYNAAATTGGAAPWPGSRP